MKQAEIVLMIVTIAAGLDAAGSAVAPANPATDFAPQMRESTYAPAKSRDPFDRPGQQVTKTSTSQTPIIVQAPKRQIPPAWFRLQAILLDRRSPMAVVNAELLELNKPATMRVGSYELRVKAVEVGRDRVILDVEGERVEVRLEEPAAPPKPK